MFSDTIITITCYLVAGWVIVLFSLYIFENEFLVVFPLLLATGYFPGGWWTRWSMAALKFQVAKRKEENSNCG
jgi:hypothetical protein